MQRKVLESLVSRGSLVGIICSKSFDVEKVFSGFARSLCGNAPFSFEAYSRERGSARTFLSELRSRCAADGSCIFVRFSREIEGDAAGVLASMRMAIVVSADGEEIPSETLSELEALAPFPSGFFWWVAPRFSKRRFPKLARSVRGARVSGFRSALRIEQDGELSARTFEKLLRIRILRDNTLSGWPRLFRLLFVPFALVAILIPFLVPSKLDSGTEMSRNIKSELAFYSEAPYFDYTFDGTETLERIARYAVGRFTATVTTEKTLGAYIAETLEKNDLPESAFEKGKLHVPPEGTSVRFSIPENIFNPNYDSIAPAWKFFTQIIGDSVAYVTELYNKSQTKEMRKHEAWDVASRSGARILSPFSGKAWTFKDERGGIVIGIVGDARVILFMHCDQLLYLDGQNVMRGDPVATVGTTGHTTGPHVHIVTGVVDRRGKKKLGNVSYRVVNPVTWYYSGK